MVVDALIISGTKKLYHWEKINTSIITLLMANIVWKILIPQICIDFQGKTVHAQKNYCSNMVD